jgi:cysteinyl-tRNA synthetase
MAKDEVPRPRRQLTDAQREALDREFASGLDGLPRVTCLTGCEDEEDMNAEDREALKRHDLLIDENRDRITALMSEYRADQKWLRQTMEAQNKKLDKLSERVDHIDRTVNNGIKERQIGIDNRLGKLEAYIDNLATKDDLAVHKEDEERRDAERWDGLERRKGERDKQARTTISIIMSILTFLSVVGLYLGMVL